LCSKFFSHLLGLVSLGDGGCGHEVIELFNSIDSIEDTSAVLDVIEVEDQVEAESDSSE